MNKLTTAFLASSLTLFGIAVGAHADVVLPTVFSDGMVLQREAPDTFWGTARPGEHVAVSLAGRSATAVAGTDGHWRCVLSYLPAGSNHTLTVTGDNVVTVHNVDVGEVWLAARDADMRAALDPGSYVDTRFIKWSADPDLRMYVHAAGTPGQDAKPQWERAAPETVVGWSAIAYHFAWQIRSALHVPVGVIQVTASNSPIASWLNPDSLAPYAPPREGPDPVGPEPVVAGNDRAGQTADAYELSKLPLMSKDALLRFEIAGADRKFVWATATVVGDCVVVSSPLVPAPVAVRYAWADNPSGCNLSNVGQVPASPFRTDHWPD